MPDAWNGWLLWAHGALRPARRERRVLLARKPKTKRVFTKSPDRRGYLAKAGCQFSPAAGGRDRVADSIWAQKQRRRLGVKRNFLLLPTHFRSPQDGGSQFTSNTVAASTVKIASIVSTVNVLPTLNRTSREKLRGELPEPQSGYKKRAGRDRN